MNARLIWGGLKSYLPVPVRSYTGTGGTSSAAYSYTIWLRHLSLISGYLGQGEFKPRDVVEIGPGDSIGVGIAALLSVANSYVGLDVLPHSNTALNLRMLDELATLFKQRAPLPDDEAFPRAYPRLRSYAFSDALIAQAELEDRLCSANIARLRAAIQTMHEPEGIVTYKSRWDRASVAPESADLVISQGALQDMDHTQDRDDLRSNLAAMSSWLRPGGVMSHHIEMACPGGEPWNHHWTHGPRVWRVIRGNRPYYKNRVPLSEYKRLVEDVGCSIIGLKPLIRNGIARKQAAPSFRELPDEDFRAAASLIVAVKR